MDRHTCFFIGGNLNRLKVILLLFLFSLQSVFSPNLFAEVVTQSFDGNRQALMPGVLLTRLVNTVAINYHQKDYKVKHLKTIETKEGMEGGPRDTESIKNIGQKLLFAMTFGDNSSMPDYGFEISGGNEKITNDTSYPSSDVTRSRKRDISFQQLNIHVGANLSPVGLDNLALGLLYHLSPNKMDTTINAATPYFYNNNQDELEGEFKMVGWNLVYNLPKTLFVYDFIYLSLGASTITFTMDSANTQVQWNGMQTTVTGPNKMNNSDKLKDYVGGAAILTEKYRAEYYHFLRKNESETFTEQSESQIDKVEVEAIFGAPEFLHVLGKELYFSAFFLQNINNLIQPQGAADVYMFGVDTKWNKVIKNGIGLGFSPSTGMSYGLGISQEEFEVSAYDLGDMAKALRVKEVSGLVAGLGIGYNW